MGELKKNTKNVPEGMSPALKKYIALRWVRRALSTIVDLADGETPQGAVLEQRQHKITELSHFPRKITGPAHLLVYKSSSKGAVHLPPPKTFLLGLPGGKRLLPQGEEGRC